MARKQTSAGVFQQRLLTIAVVPIDVMAPDGGCGACTCSYCSGGCTNCTTSCKGPASTKHLVVNDPLEEVELDEKAILKAVTKMVEGINQQ
jgi:hypothetical protein